MVRRRVGPLALGFTIIGLLGAALVVGMPAFAGRAAAQVERSGPPPRTPGTVEWRFSEPQPDWTSVDSSKPAIKRHFKARHF
jgi:hypothetical protein